jgi:zinc protease
MIPLLLALSSAHGAEVPHESFTLDNGLEVLLIPDRSLPKVVVDVWYDVGSYDDPQGRSGFAHLFEHLMFKGTPRVGEGRFDALMEQAGGWNNATTSDERTNYFDVGPSSALELLLWLEADRMTSLDITQQKLDVEREVVRNEKRQNYEDRPYGMMWIELPRSMFPASNPLHRSGIGSHEELMAATLQDVTSFYETWYVPSNAVLAIAGDFDPKATKALVQRLFGPLPARPKPTRTAPQAPDLPARAKIVLEDDVSLPLSLFAWHAPAAYSPEAASFEVLARVLAGSEDARLARRLVHEERAAVEVDASMWSERWGGMFVVDATLPPGSDGAALDRAHALLREELDALAGDQPPTADEVARAVRNLEVESLREVETLLGRAERLQRYRMYVGRFDYLDEDLARYRAVTPEAVAASARALTAARAAELTIVPRAEAAPVEE